MNLKYKWYEFKRWLKLHMPMTRKAMATYLGDECAIWLNHNKEKEQWVRESLGKHAKDIFILKEEMCACYEHFSDRCLYIENENNNSIKKENAKIKASLTRLAGKLSNEIDILNISQEYCHKFRKNLGPTHINEAQIRHDIYNLLLQDIESLKKDVQRLYLINTQKESHGREEKESITGRDRAV